MNDPDMSGVSVSCLRRKTVGSVILSSEIFTFIEFTVFLRTFNQRHTSIDFEFLDNIEI